MDHLVSFPDSLNRRRLIIRIQAFFTFGLACFTGSLFDSYGHKPLIIGGTVSLVLGFCMLSLCTQYYQFFLVHASLIAWGSNLLSVPVSLPCASGADKQIHLPDGCTGPMVLPPSWAGFVSPHFHCVMNYI